MLILPGIKKSSARRAWQHVVKRVPDNRTGNTNLVDDPDLQLPVDANAGYAFKAHLFVSTLTGTGVTINCAWVGPAGSTLTALYDLCRSQFDFQHPSYLTLGTTLSSVLSISGASPLQLRFAGILRTGSAGIFKFRWSQFSNNVRYLLLPGSSLSLMGGG